MSEIKRLRKREQENNKPKRLLADSMLDTGARKEVSGKSSDTHRPSKGGTTSLRQTAAF